MARNNIPLLISFIVGLILFDALQQEYYLTRFNLSNEEVRLAALIKWHFLRWLTWALFAIPIGLITWKKFLMEEVHSVRSKLFIILFNVVSIVLALSVISIVNIFQFGLDFTSKTFLELFEFYTFQKGLAFFMAYFILTLLIQSYKEKKELSEQAVEISNLKSQSEELVKSIEIKNAEPHLSIKTGIKKEAVPISQIVWIQADDYCVKVHTQNNAYTLRKSLKSLEKLLEPFKFIRVHRGALLNLHYVDQIKFDSSTIQLSDSSKLPLSKAGLKTLKREIGEFSI